MSIKSNKAQKNAVETIKAQAKKANASVTIKAPVTVETTKTQDKKAKHVVQFIVKGAAEDALNGRIGARTHSIHAVLLDAARVGALLSTKMCTELASAHLGAACNATAAHFNTMKKREYLVRENGAWRLTDDALALCDATWAQDSEAPVKKVKAPVKK